MGLGLVNLERADEEAKTTLPKPIEALVELTEDRVSGICVAGWQFVKMGFKYAVKEITGGSLFIYDCQLISRGRLDGQANTSAYYRLPYTPRS